MTSNRDKLLGNCFSVSHVFRLLPFILAVISVLLQVRSVSSFETKTTKEQYLSMQRMFSARLEEAERKGIGTKPYRGYFAKLNNSSVSLSAKKAKLIELIGKLTKQMAYKQESQKPSKYNNIDWRDFLSKLESAAPTYKVNNNSEYALRVCFFLDSGGHMQDLELIQSSGSDSIDRSIMSKISGSRFPKIPDSSMQSLKVELHYFPNALLIALIDVSKQKAFISSWTKKPCLKIRRNKVPAFPPDILGPTIRESELN